MGGKSKKQTVGHEYRMDFVAAIGCPIEDVLAVKFDNRDPIYGTRTPLMLDERQYGVKINIDAKTLYGQDEGGVAGDIRFYFGTSFQPADSKYARYMTKNGKPPVAYQGFLSYGYLDNFYIGNMKQPRESKYLVKRVNTRIDQDVAKWYPEKAEISTYKVDGQEDYSDIIFADKDYNFIDDTQNWNLTVIEPTHPDSCGGFTVGTIGAMPGFYSASVKLLASVNYQITLLCDNLCTYSVSDQNVQVIELERSFITGGEHVVLDVITHLKDCHLTITTENTYASINPGGVSPASIYYRAKVLGRASTHGADINPVHEIYELWTDDTALNHPVSDINDANFRAAADRIHAEGLGISYAVQNANCKDLIDDLCAHIHAKARKNRKTGQLELVLFRDDLIDLDNVPHLTKSQIKNFKHNLVNASNDTINTLNVSYGDREKDKEVSFPIYHKAAILNAGKEMAQDLKYPYFSNQRNAAKAGQWELKRQVTPKIEGEFDTPVDFARDIERFDVIKISPGKRGINALPVVITSIDLGGTGEKMVRLKYEEYVPFSAADYQDVIIEKPIVVDRKPVQSEFIVFEATYLDFVQVLGQQEADSKIAYAPHAGYLGVVALQPNGAAINGVLYTNDADEFTEVGNVDWCPHCILDQDIDRVATSFAVKNASMFDEVEVGSQIRIGTEIMVFMHFDEVTNIMTVKRGASPTIPKPHLKDAVLFCVDNFETFDLTAYQDGEIVEAKVLTVASGSMQDLATADIQSIEISGLVNRPHPPANVLMNDVSWPDVIEDHLTLTWAHRNRVQQTGGVPIAWYEQSITVESGVTYTVELYDDETNLLKHRVSEINANTVVIDAVHYAPQTKIRLFAVRDGYESQAFEHVFSSAALEAPYNAKLRYIADLQPPYNIKLEYL